jgi:hypothetical protein
MTSSNLCRSWTAAALIARQLHCRTRKPSRPNVYEELPLRKAWLRPAAVQLLATMCSTVQLSNRGIALLTASVALGFAVPAFAAPQQILVEVVKCPVMVFDSPDQKTGVPLKSGKQTVAAGKWLKAGKAGKTFGVVRAYTLRGVKESKTDKWLALTPLAAAEASPYAAMLAEIMRPAGRMKGAPTPVALWYPAQFGKTWADNFHFRWAPTTVKTVRFKVTIDESTVPLWDSGQVDAATISLNDPTLAEELKKALGAGVSSLTLEIQADEETFQRPLSLAVAGAQPELAKELKWWSKHAKGVAAHLGQAGAFLKRGFLSDSAQCYLAAWQAAPGSALAKDSFRGSLARLGLDDLQIQAVMRQVKPAAKR